MKSEDNLIIINETKGKLPRLPFLNIKNKILGKKYILSIVIVSREKIKKLNKNYRKVNSPTDILSFSLEKNIGEIFICQEIAKKKAPSFEKKYEDFLVFLLIHGMVHLLGFEHGKRMEGQEEVHRRYFQI